MITVLNVPAFCATSWLVVSCLFDTLFVSLKF